MGSFDPLDSVDILDPIGTAESVCQQNEQVWELITTVMVLFLLVLVQAGIIFWVMTRKRKINPADIVELQGIQIDTLAELDVFVDEKYRCKHTSTPVYLYTDPFQQAQEVACGAGDEEAVNILRNFFVDQPPSSSESEFDYSPAESPRVSGYGTLQCPKLQCPRLA